MYTIGKFKRLYGFNGECNFVEKCGSIQTIHTPESLVEKMIDIAKPGIDDKILVMFNVEFVIALKNMGCKNITYFSDSERMTNLVEKMYINNIGNSEVEVVYMENFKKEFRNLSKILENMKFDLIISNPPYNHNLDLKILKEVYEFSDKICFVHPAGWLYNNKEKNKNEIRHIVKDSFVYYEDVKDANKQFGIGVFSNVFITLFDKNTTDVIDIYSIDVHGSSDIYKSIKRKILNYCKNSNLLNHVSLNKKKYYCSFSKLRGNPGTSDFYTFIQLQKPDAHLHNNMYHCNFNFDNETYARNFFHYLKTKIIRFCLSIYKNDANMVSYNPYMKRIVNGAIASVPYMPTYERPWTDEEVAEELGLTDEELAWAINWIPDYYPEDKEKYAKRI